MSRLIDDLLLLAQAEHPDFLRPERIDLRTFVEQLWDGISLTADRHFELGPVPAGALRADPDRLAQALQQPGPQRDRADQRAGAGLVSLDVDQPAPGQIRFIVTDDGPGIPAGRARARVRALPPHRSGAQSRRGGAGLGLAIVRAIAEAHHGEVRAVRAGAGRDVAPGSSWCCRASSRRSPHDRRTYANGTPVP